MKTTLIQTIYQGTNTLDTFKLYFSTVGVFYDPNAKIEDLIFNIETGEATIEIVETIDSMLYRTKATFENFFPKTISKSFMF